MRYIHLIPALLFALFAYWQLNDPDGPLWVVMYGAVAVVAGWHAFGRPPLVVTYLVLGAALIWMLTLVPGFIDWVREGTPNIAGQMKAETPYIELMREFLGLLLCCLAVGFYLRSDRRALAVA
jgi:hypothetical protein